MEGVASHWGRIHLIPSIGREMERRLAEDLANEVLNDELVVPLPGTDLPPGVAPLDSLSHLPNGAPPLPTLAQP